MKQDKLKAHKQSQTTSMITTVVDGIAFVSVDRRTLADKNYDKLSKALEFVCAEYNRYSGMLPTNINLYESCRRMYPTGFNSIQKMEEALNKTSESESQYDKWIQSYKNGWTTLFTKVTKAYQQQAKGK